MKGVTKEELEIIKNILVPFKKKYKFFVYGSRVKGDFRELSDLDLMIRCEKEVCLNDIEQLKESFDNSNLPYVVNIVDYFSMTDSFYNMIRKDLIQL